MKFRNLSRTLLAFAGSAGLSLGLTSCSADHTVGYIYVTGTQYNQISALREDNNNGTLANVPGSPISSGGANPVRAVVPSGNRFLYVLNAGTSTTDTNPTAAGGAPNPTYGQTTYASSNIALFSIGGYGQLTPQLQYSSQGFGSQRLITDAAGGHLFVLDQYANVGAAAAQIAPTAVTQSGPTANYPCQDAALPNVYHPTGAITVFAIDGSTGRLSVEQNLQQQNLTYFPVGCNPVDFRLAGGYIYTMDAGSASHNDVQTVYVYAVNNQTAQLTPTQTSAIQVTGNGSSNISAMTGDNGGHYIYLLDNTNNKIYLYTVGTNGALVAVTGSPYDNSTNTAATGPLQGPIQTVTDSTNKFLFVANGGPAGGTANANSDIGGYSVDATTGFFDAKTQTSPYPGTISGPVCIFEDPTNQYIYAAGALDNSITGRKLDPNTGTLRPLNKASTFPTVGTPSWCLGISSAF